MEWILLAAIVALAAIIVVAAYYVFKLTLKLAVWLILNALGGLFILLVLNFILNMSIPYDLPTLLICTLCGVPGAICIGILALFGIYL